MSELLSLSGLRGQPDALAALRPLAESAMPLPPLLLHGPEGCGKRSAALALAARLVCREPRGCDGCGRCPACRRLTIAGQVTELRARSTAADSPMSYPDLGLISVPGRKTRISVLQARDIVLSLGTQPFEFSHRVYIVDPADRLTPAAANALLKVLEEPPAWGVLILVTTDPWSLPVTVRSRLRPVRFRRLEQRLIEELLRARGLEDSDSRERAAASRGSLSRAIEIDPRVAREQREAWIEAIEGLQGAAGIGGRAVLASEQLAGDAGQARQALDELLLLLRDAAAVGAGAPPLELSDAELSRLRPWIEQTGSRLWRRLGAVLRLRTELAVFHRNPRLAIEGAVLALAGLWTPGRASR